MKKQILIFTASLFMIALSVTPAQAQNARFKFAPQFYAEEQTRGPRSSYHPNFQTPPQTSVISGSVPKASSLFGFNPTFLATPSVSTVSSSIVRAPMAPPRNMQCPEKATPQWLAWQPTPRAVAPMIAAPTSTPAPTRSLTTANVAGKMSTHPQRLAHSASARQPLSKPFEIKSRKTPAIANYGADHLYSPGDTRPTASFVDTQEVNGKIVSAHPGRR